MKKKCIDSSTIIASLTRKLSVSILMLAAFASPSWGRVESVEIVGNPTVKTINYDERVTVRIKVKDAQNRPIMGLQHTNFKLKVDREEFYFNTRDWKSPQQSTPPPAWIIVLLDMSGSMDKKDNSQTRKIDGAIDAIEQFIKKASSEGGDSTKIAIVPFGESGPKCSQGYKINQNTLGKFFTAQDIELTNNLDNLQSKTPCASTNLYQPLKKAIRFFGDTNKTDFYPPEDSGKPQPRLSIILLSDGYHNAGNQEEFQSLKNLVNRKSEIIIHTLGYGLTPKELGEKYNLRRPATREDIGRGPRKVPPEEFVDKQRLAEIANLTGGIAEFSGDAETIAENLQVFLKSLLGEYEISYIHPNAERGNKHQVQVVVNSQGDKPVESKPKGYTIPVFGRSVPLPQRLAMLSVLLVVISLGGILPFYLWGKRLKKEAQRN